MKKYSIIALCLCLYIGGCKSQKNTTSVTAPVVTPKSNTNPQHSRNPFPRIPIESFAGKWIAEEKCQAGLPIVISVKDSSSLFISGLFGNAGKVTGSVRGYVVTILPHTLQQNDISGRMVLTNDLKMLKAYVTIGGTGRNDSCMISLHR